MDVNRVIEFVKDFIEKDRAMMVSIEKSFDELTGMMLYIRSDLIPNEYRDKFDEIPFSKANEVAKKLGINPILTKDIDRLTNQIKDSSFEGNLDKITLKTVQTLVENSLELEREKVNTINLNKLESESFSIRQSDGPSIN